MRKKRVMEIGRETEREVEEEKKEGEYGDQNLNCQGEIICGRKKKNTETEEIQRKCDW